MTGANTISERTMIAIGPEERRHLFRGNLVSPIVERATLHPGRRAIVVPTDWSDREVLASDQLSFGDLTARAAMWQQRLHGSGLLEGARVLPLLSGSVDFFAAAIAIMASGMTVVLVDRGMSLSRMRASVRAASPDAVLVGPEARRWARVVPELRHIERHIPASVGAHERLVSGVALAVVDREPDDEAIISFTSGSTGKPKGADRTHGLLLAQSESLERSFPTRADDVCLTAWPVLVIHGLLVGTPSILPPVRLGALRAVPPEATLAFAIDHAVTVLAGPPAFLDPLVRLARRRQARPALRQIATGGAPVYPELCRRVIAGFPLAEGIVLYGGTEAEPVAHCPMEELVAGDDAGICGPGTGLLVGRPVPDIDVRIVEITGAPMTPASIEDVTVEPGAWGEVAVRGAHVLSRWFRNPNADAATRIHTKEGDWLRIGDIARVDESGRLWIGGRTSDVVYVDGRTIHPYELEPALDQLPGVRRAALLADPGGGAELFVDVEERSEVATVLARVRHALDTMDLADVPVHGPVTIPVDGRHNSKVDRPTLRDRRLRYIIIAPLRRRLAAIVARVTEQGNT